MTDNTWLDFTGKVALVTGGTSGIGLAIAQTFAEARAKVFVVGMTQDKGLAAVEQIRDRQHGAQVHFLQADVSNPEQIAEVVEFVRGEAGRLDALVCAAGVGLKARLVDTSPDDLSRLLRINVQGCVQTVQAAVPLLMENGGSVVLISSDAGTLGESHAGAYSVTKAAVDMAGKMLAVDLAPHHIRVNTIAPGDIVPGMRTMVRPGESHRPATDYQSWPVPPLGRYGQPTDVASTALWLCSDVASFITGAVILVDGGMRAGFRG